MNADLADYEQLRMIVVAKEPWSIENGCLTPTMKIKRNVVNKKYASNIDALYASPEGKAAAAPAE